MLPERRGRPSAPCPTPALLPPLLLVALTCLFKFQSAHAHAHAREDLRRLAGTTAGYTAPTTPEPGSDWHRVCYCHSVRGCGGPPWTRRGVGAPGQEIPGPPPPQLGPPTEAQALSARKVLCRLLKVGIQAVRHPVELLQPIPGARGNFVDH